MLRKGYGRESGYYQLEAIIVLLANFKCTHSGERMRQPACRTHPAFPDLQEILGSSLLPAVVQVPGGSFPQILCELSFLL